MVSRYLRFTPRRKTHEIHHGERQLKIAVLGAGALGCALGGVLTEDGNEVWLVNRGREHVDAMCARGLVMREQQGIVAGSMVERTVPVHAAIDCHEIAVSGGPVDLLIVLVKSFHTEAAIASALPIVGPGTTVLSLQNGLGHEDVLAAAVGRERVIAGKTYAGGVLLGPGRIVVGIRGKETIIGELDGSTSDRIRAVAAVFNAAGLVTTISTNIVGAMWDKLLVNVATGALSAITRLPYGQLYAVPEVEATAVAAVAEGIAVARAHGVTLTATDPCEPWLKAAAGLPFEFKASMLQSIEKGSVTEIDYVNGAVVRWGARAGVPTPVNQALVACVKGVEKSLAPHATIAVSSTSRTTRIAA